MSTLSPIIYFENKLKLLDQRALPHLENYILCSNIEDVFIAIRDMVVRGAPCIGFTGLYGLALWLRNEKQFDVKKLINAANYLSNARPTAVNLKFELDRALELLDGVTDGSAASVKILSFARTELELSETRNRKMAKFVIEDLKKIYANKKLKILTHCNTGFLACGSVGTALGVIQCLAEIDLCDHVYVDETRPYLQGSRLTSYELKKLEINHSIVVEGAASHLMKNGMIDAVVVGADRIALNGDTANKVGTSNLSIIAKYYDIPFYVVAPKSSFDLLSLSGEDIEVELRDENEIHFILDKRISPEGVGAFNPSFDISDGKLITAISCEEGLIRPPFFKTISERFNV